MFDKAICAFWSNGIIPECVGMEGMQNWRVKQTNSRQKDWKIEILRSDFDQQLTTRESAQFLTH